MHVAFVHAGEGIFEEFFVRKWNEQCDEQDTITKVTLTDLRYNINGINTATVAARFKGCDDINFVSGMRPDVEGADLVVAISPGPRFQNVVALEIKPLDANHCNVQYRGADPDKWSIHSQAYKIPANIKLVTRVAIGGVVALLLLARDKGELKEIAAAKYTTPMQYNKDGTAVPKLKATPATSDKSAPTKKGKAKKQLGRAFVDSCSFG